MPDRTRTVIENRDRGCRVPGCPRDRWPHIHHILHWEDGGTTDTTNLIALGSRHHRLHHQGHLGITGNADDPDGIELTDQRGRPLAPNAAARAPNRPLPEAARRLAITPGQWAHPPGEQLDTHWIDFTEPPSPSPNSGHGLDSSPVCSTRRRRRGLSRQPEPAHNVRGYRPHEAVDFDRRHWRPGHGGGR